MTTVTVVLGQQPPLISAPSTCTNGPTHQPPVHDDPVCERMSMRRRSTQLQGPSYIPSLYQSLATRMRSVACPMSEPHHCSAVWFPKVDGWAPPCATPQGFGWPEGRSLVGVQPELVLRHHGRGPMEIDLTERSYDRIAMDKERADVIADYIIFNVQRTGRISSHPEATSRHRSPHMPDRDHNCDYKLLQNALISKLPNQVVSNVFELVVVVRMRHVQHVLALLRSCSSAILIPRLQINHAQFPPTINPQAATSSPQIQPTSQPPPVRTARESYAPHQQHPGAPLRPQG